MQIRSIPCPESFRLVISVPILIFLLISAFLSCSVPRETGDLDLEFAILLNRLDEPWYQAEAKGFRERCGELGARALILDNRMDPNITLANMDSALCREVDGIAIVIPEQKMSRIIIDRAFSTDTPIVSLDIKLIDHQNRQLAPHIGIISSDAGYAAGSWLANRVQDLGWLDNPSFTVGVAAMTFNAVWDMKQRTGNCRRALIEKTHQLGAESVFEVNYQNADAVGSLLAMQELLTKHTEITHWIVYAGNDEGVTGAVQALEQVGFTGNVLACGIDAGQAGLEFTKPEETAYKASIYIDSYQQGRTAAEVLYNTVVHGRPIPAHSVSHYTIITREEMENRNP
jgi:L-arabinose transport system substrate-binding protein